MMSPVSEEGTPLLRGTPGVTPTTPTGTPQSTRRWSSLTPTGMHSQESHTFSAIVTRWYILALFFMLTANQCLFWFTFSSSPTEVTAYYGISDGA